MTVAVARPPCRWVVARNEKAGERRPFLRYLWYLNDRLTRVR
jgi:hypothetical protein